MKMRNVLVLFIISFLCIIFCINHFSYKYADSRIDSICTRIKIITPPQKTTSVLTERERLVVTLCAATVAVFVFVLTKPFFGSLLMIVFLIAYFASYKLLCDNGIFVNLLAPVVSVLITPLFLQTCKNVLLSDKSGRIQKILDKYISKDLTDKIMKNPDRVELGGKKAEITVMFADIRGFTTISETRTAEEVSALLNEYFTEIEPIINKYNGVINKFIGDAVLVIFGEPVQDREHAKNAVKCAYEIAAKVKKIQEKWVDEGKPKIDIGIGINTGDAFVGNIGTQNRFEYTVIGDTVNIASRIEGYNRIYKTRILISQNTYNKLSHIVDVIKIREVDLKGKTKKIDIYEVLRITE